MPKASFTDTYKMSGNFQDGWGEIVAAAATVFQYQPNSKTGDQGPPFLACKLMIQRQSIDGVPDSGDAEEVVLKVEKSLDRMRPGSVASREQEEPEDLGIVVGTEGNCIYVAEEGSKINDNVKYTRFIHSLIEKGFKPEVLGAGYFPDLVGTRALFKTFTGKKFAADQEKDPTFLIVEQIKQFPWEKKAVAGKSKPAAVKPITKTQPATNPNPVAESNGHAAGNTAGNTATAADDHAREMIGTVASAQSGSIPYAKFKVLCFNALNKSTVPKADQKSVQSLINDSNWLSDAGADYSIAFDEDSKTVSFVK